MRAILVAAALAVLLLTGWFVKSTFLDREEQEFAVHYSWIIKWALTLARDSHQAPSDATFSSPQISEAGQPYRWRVNGKLTWRDALDNPVHETYSLVIENTCKSYADARCWTLERFALGDAPADDGSDVAAPAVAAGTIAGQIVDGSPMEASPPAADEDIVAALGEYAGSETQSPVSVPRPPLAPGEMAIPMPERKPETPPVPASGLVEDVEQMAAETELAIADPSPVTASTIADPSADAVSDLDAVADEAEAEAEAAAISPASGSPGPASEPATLDIPTDDPSLTVAEAAETDATASVSSESEPKLEPEPAPEASASATATPTAVPEDEGETETVAALPPEPLTEPIPELGVPAASTPAPSAPDAALVALIQDRLRRTGYDPGPIDGRFGQRTRTAILAYQQREGLTPDGLPTQTLFDHLEGQLASRATSASQPAVATLPTTAPSASVPASAPASVSTPSPTQAPPTAPARAATPAPQPSAPVAATPQIPAVADESLVFLIQHRLREAGFPPARFDGRMSPDTAAAIRAYQGKRGLPVDGVPTRQLLDRLETEVFSKRTPAEPTAILPASPGIEASVACAGTGADSVACAEALRQLNSAPATSGATAAGIVRDGGVAPIPQ